MGTKRKGLAGIGIVTAIASSLCCITPVLALIAGSGGVASSFAWLEPARPYLIGATVIVLGLAWYLKLRPEKVDDCNCEVPEKQSFFQSKKFLLIVTLFAIAMTLFPYYSNIFYSDANSNATIVSPQNKSTLNLQIEGMTCEGCENHVNEAVLQLEGVLYVKTSYSEEQSIVIYDHSKISSPEIINAINETGYKALEDE